ncbi:unnamed protein product [Didymodactylos carnosus]|uniref:Uncharacterized protein n=1 Tax=Didymodactylos carnosus TaxID=1234261 RepID=A0A816E2F5_9BILA|nr:unnamed protein product [Didymodactylos carnosus]CAF4561439.1 unnamed protein product [Didymodactylos carnosus]
MTTCYVYKGCTTKFNTIKKKNNNNTNVRPQQQFGTNPWTNHSNNVLYGQSQATTTTSFIEKLHDSMSTIIVQQKELDAKMENKFSTLAQEFDEYFKEVNVIKECLNKWIGPLVCVLTDYVYKQAKHMNVKQLLQQPYNHLVRYLENVKTTQLATSK